MIVRGSRVGVEIRGGWVERGKCDCARTVKGYCHGRGGRCGRGRAENEIVFWVVVEGDAGGRGEWMVRKLVDRRDWRVWRVGYLDAIVAWPSGRCLSMKLDKGAPTLALRAF